MKKAQLFYMNSGDWVENLTALEFDEGEWSMYKYAGDDFLDKNSSVMVPIRKRIRNTAVIR